ncbi:MAG: YceI family protein [Chloroflexota bacterium]|nr:YceI family protein [Chloroflexota bacterium]
MKRKSFVVRALGTLVATVALVIVAAFVLFPLGAQGKLPGQAHPTAIPVTPFANVNTTVPTGTTVAAAPPATGAILPATTTATTDGPSGATTYAVNADQSQAKVTVNEKLAFLPSNSDAVLTTNAMQGQIVLGADGKPSDGSKIQVDLRTLKSDQTMRDNYIRQTTLQSDTYPLAEFVITGADGLNGPMQNGQQTTFKLLGTMTIHGVTKPVTFDTAATMNGGTLTGTATTAFTFEDFGMTPSNKANIVTVNDLITLQMTITATRSA